jgi:hypothetical protein
MCAQKTIDTINCPSCGQSIAITETLRQQLGEEARAELQQELTARQQALACKEKELQIKEIELQSSEQEIASRVTKQVHAEKAKLKNEALKTARAEVSVQLQDLESQAEEKERKLRESEQKELQLLKEKRELESARQTLELDIARQLEEAKAKLQQGLTERQRDLMCKEKELQIKQVELEDSEKGIASLVATQVKAEKAKLTDEALKAARAEVSLQVKDLESRAAEKEQKLLESERKELELLKEKRELESAKRTLELDVVRQVNAERDRIREDGVKEASEQHRLKDAERELTLQQALKANEDMRRRLEQGSQQAQGEVLELELDRILRDQCPLDEILEVPKGVCGADVLQRVNSRAGYTCGLIIWEAKNTKNWGNDWVSKLRDDQRLAKADVAVLVSDVVPKDVDSFGLRDGVWIAKRRYVPALVLALRHTLSEVAQAKRAVASKNDSIEVLFNYMTGPEFRHRVEAIANSFVEMRKDLEKEKRTISKNWAKRAKQLDVIIVNTSGMYGDLQGLGAPLKPIAELEDGDSEEVAQIAASSDEE